MDRASAIEYSESLSQIGTGWWRQVGWAIKQGIPAEIGMTDKEWAEKYHGYLKMSLPEKQAAVAELTEQGMTRAQIGATIGVHEDTVSDIRTGRDPSHKKKAAASAATDEGTDEEEAAASAATAPPPVSSPLAPQPFDFDRSVMSGFNAITSALYSQSRGIWTPTANSEQCLRLLRLALNDWAAGQPISIHDEIEEFLRTVS